MGIREPNYGGAGKSAPQEAALIRNEARAALQATISKPVANRRPTWRRAKRKWNKAHTVQTTPHSERYTVDTSGDLWTSVLEATGQPREFR
jgi:hypothetical protein